MSYEIRTLDIENEAEEKTIRIMSFFGWELKSSQRIFNQNSRPVGAITYDDMTYIHSRTETVDFTKLVFQRDLRMPNYDDIVRLEKEFSQIAENMTGGRPPEPSPLKSFDQWSREASPPVFSTWKRILFTALSYPLGTVFTSLLFKYCISSYNAFDFSEIYAACFLPAIPFNAFFAFLFVLLIERLVKASARINKKSPQHRRFLKMYDDYKQAYQNQLDKIEFYEYGTRRISQIIQEAADLLE